MSNLVIVAVPAQDERVWKVSSEKVPHLTLLYLGDINSLGDGDSPEANVQQIVDFVDHAVTVSEHGEFMMSVDHRGELGADKADVLFFKNDWSTKWITHFRNQMLQQNDIRNAWEKADQFGAKQDWVPHLTLGYPATPANPDDSEHGLNWITFDRIAVWTGDFTGPEFRLEWPEREDMAVAYGEAAVTDILNHHGVKGMKWGVRKSYDKATKIGQGATNTQAVKAIFLGPASLLSPSFNRYTSSGTKVAVGLFGMYSLLSPHVRNDLAQASEKVHTDKADAKWAKGLNDGSAHIAVQNKLADHFNSKIDSVNAKHPKTDFRNDSEYDNPTTPANKAYLKDIHALTKESIGHAVKELDLNNPSHTRKAIVEQDPRDPLTFRIRVSDIQHADNTSEIEFKIVYTKDANGYVTGFTIDDGDDAASPAAHVIDLGAEFLSHHGVKGMRWGVRKASEQHNAHQQHQKSEADLKKLGRTAVPVYAHASIGKTTRSKATIETHGGEDHAPAHDAVKVAVARQKLAKSGIHALSNTELRDVAQRLQLEQQVAQLTGQRKSFIGKQFVDQHFTNNPKNQQKLFRFGAKKLAKPIATGLATAALL